jgi:hypothetical protein
MKNLANLANISFLVVFITYIIFYNTVNENTNSIMNNIIDVTFIIYATTINKYYGLLCCVLVLFVKHDKLIEGAAVGTNVRNLSGDVINITDLIEKHIENIKQGSAGPQGKEGPAGPKGEKGSAGPQGEKGSAGPKGEQGNTGPQGKEGPQGEQGPQGPAGVNTTESFSEYR